MSTTPDRRYVCDGCGEETRDGLYPDTWIPIVIGRDHCDACSSYCAWQILGVFREDLALEVSRDNPEWDEYEDCYVPPRPTVDVTVQGQLL